MSFSVELIAVELGRIPNSGILSSPLSSSGFELEPVELPMIPNSGISSRLSEIDVSAVGLSSVAVVAFTLVELVELPRIPNSGIFSSLSILLVKELSFTFVAFSIVELVVVELPNSCFGTNCSVSFNVVNNISTKLP